jgi:ribose 1,5-bisphosphokinase
MARASLIYVMGPSGAGKTGVIEYARRKIDGGLPVAIAHRYITRPLGKDIENYIALSPAEFALRKARGLFAFDWQAYGFDYGIGIEIKSWLASGLTVVVDGSRAHFIGRDLGLGPVVPVLVTAGSDELRRRLSAREREDAKAIEARLRRAGEFAPADLALVTIDNTGAIERAGEAFAALLAEHARSR